ncbi:uncharacterized protein ACNLHF_003493 isoform 2-T2 [Anomaloglossus baeobatrachus]
MVISEDKQSGGSRIEDTLSCLEVKTMRVDARGLWTQMFKSRGEDKEGGGSRIDDSVISEGEDQESGGSGIRNSGSISGSRKED